MEVTPRIELTCRTVEAQAFKRIGFTSIQALAEIEVNFPATNMFLNEVSRRVVSTMIGFGREGTSFMARVVGYDCGSSLLIASYQGEVISVPTVANWCQPAVRRCENGVQDTEEAKRYWIVKGKFEAALENEEERI